MNQNARRQLSMRLAQNSAAHPVSTDAEIRVYCEENREPLKDALIPLTVNRYTDEELDRVILKNPLVDGESVFVAFLNGRLVGTTTACFDSSNGRGVVHMVSVLPEASGHRVGQALVNRAIVSLACREGLKTISLTTDDFRLPAIVTYLRLGFLPVADDEEMCQRWKKILAALSMEKCLCFTRAEAPSPTLGLSAEE